ncbi:hypothetical protein SNEBB_004169 [Seison nebaliae]|nr:hypothetical protein SNEBB_004169 [Seison nebaliae]
MDAATIGNNIASLAQKRIYQYRTNRKALKQLNRIREQNGEKYNITSKLIQPNVYGLRLTASYPLLLKKLCTRHKVPDELRHSSDIPMRQKSYLERRCSLNDLCDENSCVATKYFRERRITHQQQRDHQRELTEQRVLVRRRNTRRSLEHLQFQPRRHQYLDYVRQAENTANRQYFFMLTLFIFSLTIISSLILLYILFRTLRISPGKRRRFIEHLIRKMVRHFHDSTVNSDRQIDETFMSNLF